ncbi:MAG: efflux RND transporter permease subunit [Deltaproteobacteria bacterium]|nr:efflux RND transporter permease subunit [Deltaproteobacteria bacterium]
MNALVIFIRRPVLASMVTALLLVLGLFSYRALGVDLMPKIEIPVVTITTVLRGASPEEIESQVSKPIEEVVNTISGIDELYSYSFEGMSRVMIRFVLERSMVEAAQDVRDKVATVVRTLPVGTEPPVVWKVDPDAFPVMTLSVSGPRDLKEVSEVARLRLKEVLETVDGVGQVAVVGGRKRAVNVILDVDRLSAHGIPIGQVRSALAAQNVEIPSGRIDRGQSEQVLRTLARVERVEDFADLVVATRGGRQIALGDIGRVEDSVEEPRTLARVWKAGDVGRGTPAVTLDVVKQSGTNTVDVIHRVKQRLALIEPTLPPGFRVGIVSDQSVFIERSIEELRLHLVLGGLLAAAAVLLFMRNLRATLIAAVAIPTSLIGTFALMRSQQFTLNNMTLLGLTLSVGVVIDDAIVVLENIFRHMEQYKKSPFDAAVDGLKEIGLAVMATTTSLIVIFLPMAFMSGMIGRFFRDFGLTVAGAIAISLLVSFTLTPMLSARFLKQKKAQAGPEQHRHGFLARGYGTLVGLALRQRWVTLLLCAATIAVALPIAKRLGKEFLPVDDRSELQISLIAPAGASLAAVDELFGRVEDEIHRLPAVRVTMTQIGSAQGAEDVTRGIIYVAIVDLARRDYSQQHVMKQIRAVLARYPEIRSGVNFIGGMAGGRSGAQLQYNLAGPDLELLTRVSDEAARAMRRVPGLVDVDTSLASRQPEVRVRLDRAKAADLGISAADVASTLRTMVGGEIVTKYREGVEQYDVWLRLGRQHRSDAALVEQLPVFSPKAGLVPLSQVSRLDEGVGPTEIDRYNRQRMVSLSANLDGTDLGSAMGKVAALVQKMNLPPGYGTVASGQAKMMGEMMGQMLSAFLLAFVFMYIVLAAQFESFLHPVTILLSLPLTLPFALLSLLLLRETINVYSLLGVFMLFGIVKKNGILQIDYTNTLRALGRPLREAIIEANRARLRPILMTTLTLIAGMTPIALGKGPGAAARASMAKVIIGGQALSLFVTLLIVPVAYSLFEGAKRKMGMGAGASG